jgi:arginine decarboxylase-like protein
MIKSQVDDAIKQDKMKATEGMDLLDSYEKGLSHPTYLSLETP